MAPFLGSRRAAASKSRPRGGFSGRKGMTAVMAQVRGTKEVTQPCPPCLHAISLAHCQRETRMGATASRSPQHGLFSNKAAPITPGCGTMRSPSIKMALITSDFVRSPPCLSLPFSARPVLPVSKEGEASACGPGRSDGPHQRNGMRGDQTAVASSLWRGATCLPWPSQPPSQRDGTQVEYIRVRPSL